MRASPDAGAFSRAHTEWGHLPTENIYLDAGRAPLRAILRADTPAATADTHTHLVISNRKQITNCQCTDRMPTNQQPTCVACIAMATTMRRDIHRNTASRKLRARAHNL